MESEQNNEQKNLIDPNQITAMVAEIREKAFMQIIFGLLWWLGSAVAMYFALASTSDNMIYWYGGALGSLFHWYRAFKLIRASQQIGAQSLVQREKIVIGVIIFSIIFSSLKIVPEYFRITNPEIGTCWKESSVDILTPVACWAGGKIYRTVGFSDSEAKCGTDYYLKPDVIDARFTCLEKL